MFRKIINPILSLPLLLITVPQYVISREINSSIDEVLAEKDNKIFIDYQEIKEIIINNNV